MQNFQPRYPRSQLQLLIQTQAEVLQHEFYVIAVNFKGVKH